MKTRDAEILGRLRDALLARAVPLHSLTLFGSRARGDDDPDSDMDVLVVLKVDDADSRRAVSDCAWEVGMARDVLIVPVTYSLQDWQRGPERSSLLAIAIAREGVPA